MEVCKHYIEKESRCDCKDSSKYDTECCLFGGCPYYEGIEEKLKGK